MKPTLFVHVPKTGGSTFVIEYQEAYGYGTVVNYDQSLSLNVDHLEKVFVTSHVPYSYLSSIRPGRFAFTLLRDPVERVLSWVRFKSGFRNRQGDAAKHMKIRDFLHSDVSHNIRMQTHDRMVRHFGDDYWEPYDEGIMPVVLDRACNALKELDWVCFTEDWSDRQAELCELIEMPPFEGKQHNISPEDKDYDDADIEAIREITKWDQKFYDFALGEFK